MKWMKMLCFLLQNKVWETKSILVMKSLRLRLRLGWEAEARAGLTLGLRRRRRLTLMLEGWGWGWRWSSGLTWGWGWAGWLERSRRRGRPRGARSQPNFRRTKGSRAMVYDGHSPAPRCRWNPCGARRPALAPPSLLGAVTSGRLREVCGGLKRFRMV